jgi:hypothetical protein
LRGRPYYQPSGKSENGRPYAEVFVKRVHKIVGQGYAMLTPGKFASAQEEEITGELVRAVETILDKASAPLWTRWFSIHEEPREHYGARKGKRRLRLDIRIDNSQNIPRARLRFEAKRMGPRHGPSLYLGRDGIQCFLDGRYARNDEIAGMLGYVQEGSPDDWASKIEKAMTKKSRKLHLRPLGGWRKEQLAVELPNSYRSSHGRPKVGKPIDIFHTLLIFN